MKWVSWTYAEWVVPYMGLYFAIDGRPELNPHLIPWHWLAL